MALRLKYAEVPTAAIESDLGRAIVRVLELTPAGQRIYILPTYTAMTSMRKILARQSGLAKVEQV